MIEIVSRYEALGIPLPDPETMCDGQCEGVGYYPVYGDDPHNTAIERSLWEAAEAKQPADDGYHFIKCPDCEGTGKQKAA